MPKSPGLVYPGYIVNVNAFNAFQSGLVIQAVARIDECRRITGQQLFAQFVGCCAVQSHPFLPLLAPFGTGTVISGTSRVPLNQQIGTP